MTDTELMFNLARVEQIRDELEAGKVISLDDSRHLMKMLDYMDKPRIHTHVNGVSETVTLPVTTCTRISETEWEIKGDVT